MIKYLDLYKDYLIVNKGYSINTVNSYINDIKQFFYVCKNEDINIYLDYLYSNNYSVNSLNRKLSSLNNYYKYLLLHNYINHNPFSNIEYAKKEIKIPTYLSHDEIHKIFDVIKDNYYESVVIELLYGCGLRVSELVNLKLSNIYFDEGLILCLGKGNKQRIIPINKKALFAINNYNLYIRSKIKNNSNQDYLLLSKHGVKLNRENINILIKKIAKKANINKNIHPHIFRHTFSTHLLENGANLRAIQTMLGHENISTTEIYTHVNEKKLLDDYNKYFKE